MPLPNLDDDGWTDKIDAACAAYLGSTIQYQAAGGSFVPIKAHLDYRDAAKAFDGAQVIEQDVTVALLKVSVPEKPSPACRLTLPRLPGTTFKPANVRTDESGTHWEFEVVTVHG